MGGRRRPRIAQMMLSIRHDQTGAVFAEFAFCCLSLSWLFAAPSTFFTHFIN